VTENPEGHGIAAMLIALSFGTGGSGSATVAASMALMLGQTLAGGIPVPTVQDCRAALYTPNPTLPAATQQHHRTHLDDLAHELVDRLARDLGACDISRSDASDSSPEYPLGRLEPTTHQPPKVSP
jgi:hypothetical protein